MEDLLMKVNSLEDSRQQWKVKHNLVDILIIVMLSILTGHNDFEEMVIFAEARVEILRKYINEKGKILPRRATGACAKHQREITTAVKRARHIAIVAYSQD